MKKILTLLAAFCFFQSYGQIEIGVNGGILANKTPWVGDYKSLNYTQSASISGYGSVKLLTTVSNNWQVGIGIDMATVKSNIVVEVSKAPPVNYYGTAQVGAPNIPLYLMLNRKIRAPRGYVYAGVNAGITFIVDAGAGTSGKRTIADTEKHGFQTGFQLGYTVRLINRIGANAELGARYMTTGVHNPPANVDITYDIWYFPASIGLRYSL